MIQPTSCTVQFNCKRDAGRNARSQSKEPTEPDGIAYSKNNRIRYCASQHPQRPVFPTQQVIRKVQGSQHVQTSARYADRCNCMVIYPAIISSTNSGPSDGAYSFKRLVANGKKWESHVTADP